MRVHSTFVGQEVFLDSKCHGDGAVGDQLFLDVADIVFQTVGIYSEFPAAAGGLPLALLLVLAVLTGFCALRVHLGSVITVLQSRAAHVMGTFWHSVGIAGGLVAVVTSAHHTCSGKPVPWGVDLSSIAASRKAAGEAFAAASGVSNREQRQVGSLPVVVLYAVSVVECLRGAVRPAGAAVRLVTDGADDLALRPLSAGVKGICDFI